nr:biotin--[acetyl-CoA-carboxylase] ligase [Anaerobacterium chartisolvens]
MIRVKYKVLNKLKANMGLYVSGEALSEQLGVSRTAVWKYINELKSQGYIIESSSKKGYSLSEGPEVISAYEIGHGLETQVVGKDIKYFNELDSTNTYAKLIAAEGCADGTAVIAEAQTAGKGRLGRGWSSAHKKGIWMSIVLRPLIAPEEIQIMTLAASIAVAKAIEQECHVRPGIKWPNDVLLESKKVCGILTEMNCEIERINFLVLGIGINVNHDMEDFPEALREIAGSLKECCGGEVAEPKKEFSRKNIIRCILAELDVIYRRLNTENEEAYADEAKQIVDEWKKYSVTIGRRVKAAMKGQELVGVATDITRDGRLIIACEDGSIREVMSGEVSVRGLLGYS